MPNLEGFTHDGVTIYYENNPAVDQRGIYISVPLGKNKIADIDQVRGAGGSIAYYLAIAGHKIGPLPYLYAVLRRACEEVSRRHLTQGTLESEALS